MKKGYTLMELLAVIAILSLIMLIATSKLIEILNISRENAFRDTAFGIIKAAEYDYSSHLFKGTDYNSEYYFKEGKQYSINDNKLNISGKNPENGVVYIGDKGKVSIALHDGKYCATKSYLESDVTTKETTLANCYTNAIDNVSEEIIVSAIASSISDETIIDYKKFYTIGYVLENDSFPKEINYTIDLDGFPIPVEQIEVANVSKKNVIETLEDFKRYIIRKNMGDVSFPDGDNTFFEIDYAETLKDHSLKSSNMTINDITITCDTSCSASLDITVNNIDGVDSVNVNGQDIIYVPSMFTVDLEEAETNFEFPNLVWSKKNYSDFGYTQHSSETRIDVYDNGNAQIAVYYTDTPYMSYYNHSTNGWTVVDSPYWAYGAPVILWAGDGIFLAKITGMANIIASYDGITWYNAGYCEGAQNAMTTGAYDTTNNSGIVSWWYYKTPVYYSFDSLTERTAWNLTGSDGTSVPIFKYLTTHKNSFVGVAGDGKSILTTSTSNPISWNTNIAEDIDETNYMYIRSINDVLFVMKYTYTNIDGDYTYYVTLCVLNDDATNLTETNLNHVGNLADNHIANPQNIIWMDSWNKFAIFSEGMLYVSDDGITWEGEAQSGFTVSSLDTFAGSIYVSGDGFYVKASGYVYYAPY